MIGGLSVSEWMKIMEERMAELDAERADEENPESRQSGGDDDGGPITIEIGVMSAEELRKALLGVPIPDSDGDVPGLIGWEPVPDGTYECGCEWDCDISYRVWRSFMGTVLRIRGRDGKDLSVVLNDADIFRRTVGG